MADNAPTHGDASVCQVCLGTIEYLEEAVFEVGQDEPIVLATWWSHETHPADEHEAIPVP